MKKSELYTCAILAVLDSDMKTSIKADVVELLLNEKSYAVMIEKAEVVKG